MHGTQKVVSMNVWFGVRLSARKSGALYSRKVQILLVSGWIKADFYEQPFPHYWMSNCVCRASCRCHVPTGLSQRACWWFVG